MKKMMLRLLIALLICSLFGCGTASPETTAPTETTEPVQTTVPVEETTVPETTLPQPPAGTVSLGEMIAGSDMELTVEEGTITLSEDGLTVELTTDSKLVSREGYVVAVLAKRPLIIGQDVYVQEDFFHDFLCRDNDFRTDGDQIRPSLFNGVKFFAGEILDALKEPETAAFHQKLLAQVLLPGSMGIETPNINNDRVFQTQPLFEYSQVFIQELTDLGYEDAALFTYSEYEVLSGAQTLAQAGISSDYQTTVAEYTWQQREQSWNQFVNGLSDEEKAFAQAKQITLSDLLRLDRVFYGGYMDQSDDALRDALEEYYAAALGYLESLSQGN